MYSDHRISYWRKGLRTQNFGDFLSELLVRAFSSAGLWDRRCGRPRREYDVIHLIGSVIADINIQNDLEHAGFGADPAIAFWGCGKRDAAAIPNELLERCRFLGVRGPLTRDALGLAAGTPMGDPALLLPIIHKPRPSAVGAGKIICMPHFLEPLPEEELIKRTGAEVILRPNIAPDMETLLGLVDALATARFVLAGALHAAIVACAFGRPFAFFDSGYIDVPFKWEDFAASVNIPCRFARSVAEGIEIYQMEIRGNYFALPLEPILAGAPIVLPWALSRRARDADTRGRSKCA
jgi:hypothetical protein